MRESFPLFYYWKAAGAGVVASAVWAVIYSSLLVAARILFGTIFVGVIIATTMRTAAKGSGSLRYRLTAVVLTYLAASVRWGFILYDKRVSSWMMAFVGLISPIYRIQASSNSMISVTALCVGLGTAWTIAGGDAAPGIYVPFEWGAGRRL